MSKVSIEAVSEPMVLGEGPHWVQKEKRLYVSDIFGEKICRIDPQRKNMESIKLNSICSFILPISGTDGDFILGQGREINRLNWSSKESVKLTEIIEATESNRMNDGKCDPKGRLYFGTMGTESSPAVLEPELGSLYKMESDLNMIKLDEKITLSNGIGWSSNKEKMYFIDSITRLVYVYDYDLNTGNLVNRKDLFKSEDTNELPDGMTVDRDGHIWIAYFNGGNVKKIDPETGKLLRTIKFPVKRVTSLCFGGEDFETMFVTSAKFRLSEEQLKEQPLAGSVFKVQIMDENVKGLPANEFVNK